MFHNLKYDVTFPVTGRRLAANIDFETGLSAISGRNEAGKSTVLEMLRFLLHGSSALRGKVDDYKTLKATGEFTVKGERYSVERTIRLATLKRNDMVLATGTSAVNDKIIQIFGYGPAVFEVANFCGQGKVEALGEMRPTERKRMVDQTIGFDTIDELARWASETASATRKSAAAIERAMGDVPTPPVKPEGYEPAATIEAAIRELQPLAEEAQHIRGWLAAQNGRREPQEPTCKVSLPVGVLEAQVEEYRAVEARRAALKARLQGLPEPAHTVEELDAMESQWQGYEAWQDHLAFERRNPRPSHGRPALEAMAEQNSHHNNWIEKLKLERAIEAADKITCPDCGSEFALHQEHVARLREKLSTYDGAPVSDTPAELTFDQITKQLQLHEAWQEYHIPEEVKKPALTRAEIDKQRRALETIEVRRELAEMGDLMEDPSPKLRERQLYDERFTQYLLEKGEWTKLQGERKVQEARLAEIGDVVSQIATLVDRKNASIEYEARTKSFLDAKDRYDQNLESLKTEKEQLDQFERVAKALKTLRSKIKMHLVPSLNLVAGQYLNRMTGGERSEIRIDEDFENILVDGQRLETLSGSAKAVANLAIRLGLGQVLTNRVFSVFLGDEIDASMDADRAGYTAECFASLSKVISQVVLVSHKKLEADHQITL